MKKSATQTKRTPEQKAANAKRMREARARAREAKTTPVVENALQAYAAEPGTPKKTREAAPVVVPEAKADPAPKKARVPVYAETLPKKASEKHPSLTPGEVAKATGFLKANPLASVVAVSVALGTSAGRPCDAGKWNRCPAVHRFVNAWRLANGVAK